MDGLDQLALVVRLDVAHTDSVVFALPNGGGDVISQGLRPVDGRFAVAEKVEVRP